MWKQRTVDKQSVFFAFPFAATNPEVSYELPGAGTSASAPQRPRLPQHMRAIRHWAALAEGGNSIAWATVDAPLVQFGDIHSPYSPFPGTLRLDGPEPGTIYSWVLNNIWDTNFPTEQGGRDELPLRRHVRPRGRCCSARYPPRGVSQYAAGSYRGTLGRSSRGDGAIGQPVRDRATLRSGSSRRPLRQGAAICSCGSTTWPMNEVTTRIDFPGLVVKAAMIGTVFEEDQVGLPMTGGSLQVSLKPGETRALSLLIS